MAVIQLGNESTWKYKIDIKKVVKFEQPLDINQFQKMNGTYLKTAPKNFCYIQKNNFWKKKLWKNLL